jgi:hypothetical protein
MKKTHLLLGIALAWALTSICPAQTTATSSSTASAGSTAPYTEGPVWTITMVKTKPGMDDDYLKALAKIYKATRLEHLLDCTRRVEREAAILFRRAVEDGHDFKIIASLRIYTKALEATLRIEKCYHEEVEHRRNLISMEFARRLMCNGVNMIISNLAELPMKVGLACNPEAPAEAITVLEAECANIILDAKNGFSKEISEGMRWPK